MHPLYLMSIGIVAEDGREFYGQLLTAPLHLANDWVKENVIPHLEGGIIAKEVQDDVIPHYFYTGTGEETKNIYENSGELGQAIIKFIGDDSKPEIWGYYADYDWVVFCQLFGRMIDLPKGFPMYCRDIKQLCDDLGNLKLPEQDSTEHHALEDARWNKRAYEFLMEAKKENK